MDNYRIFVSEPAIEDMAEIAAYISTQLNSPDTAENMLDAFHEAISSLACMPKRYPLVRDDLLASLGYRLMPVKNYNVLFSVNESLSNARDVNIERVLYSKRNWKHLLNPLLE